MTEEIVFKRFPKTDIDDADVTFSGRMLHSRAAATGKVRSLMVERRSGASANKRWCRCRAETI